MSKINKNFLSVVVLFWNNSSKTIKCLESIFKQKKINFTLVLVDNNSERKYSNQILSWLKKRKIKIHELKKTKINFKGKNLNKQCVYIKNKINYGCGLGHNSGYEFSLNNDFKYISRIDNDMILPNDLLFKLSERLDKQKEIIALSPKVMYLDKPKLIWFRGAKIGNNLKLQKQCSEFIPGQKDSPQISGLVHTDAIVGCASMMRAKNLKIAGLSDPDFFYGEEDIELSYRLIKTKGKLVVDLDQKIYHAVSFTIGKNWAKNIYYNYKYRLVLLKKIGTNFDKLFGYSVFVIKFLIMILMSYRRKNSSKVVPIFMAGIHFLKKYYGDYDRKYYQSIDYFFKKYDKRTTILDIIKNTL